MYHILHFYVHIIHSGSVSGRCQESVATSRQSSLVQTQRRERKDVALSRSLIVHAPGAVSTSGWCSFLESLVPPLEIEYGMSGEKTLIGHRWVPPPAGWRYRLISKDRAMSESPLI